MKMMNNSKMFLTICVALILSNAIAQSPNYSYTNQFINPSFDFADSSKNQLVLQANVYTKSNSITNSILFSALNGSYIDPATKSRIAGYAGKYVKYEDQLKGGLHYKHYFSKKKLHLLVGYQYRNFRNLIAAKDAVRIVLEGNTPFVDKNANIGNIFFENIQYNQYSLGLVKNVDGLEVGVNASFLQGINSQQLKNQSGYIYTAPYGEYLDIKQQINYNQASKAVNKFGDMNGLGYSIDLHFAYAFPKFKLALDVQDLGSITWQKNLTNYISKDTTIHFEGVYVDLPNLIKTNNLTINADTLLSQFGIEKKSQKFISNLPASFQLTASIPAKIKKTPITVNVLLQTKLLSKYYVSGMVKTNFYLPKNWIVAPSVSAGGYAPFALGIDIGKKTKHFDFYIGSDNLIGTCLPKFYPGASVYLLMAAKF